MDRKLFVTPIVQVLEMMTMIELNETKFRSDFATKKNSLGVALPFCNSRIKS